MAGGALAGAGLLGTQDSGPGLASPLADLGNPFGGWGWGEDSESMSGGARDFFANMSADDEAQYAKVRQILDDDQLRHLRTIFDRQDEDGSGEIDAHELRQAMHDLGTELSMFDAKRLLTSIDSDGNGSISFWEFVEFFTPRIGSKQGGNIDSMVATTLRQQTEATAKVGKLSSYLRIFEVQAQACQERVQKLEADIDEIKENMKGANGRSRQTMRQLEMLTRAKLAAEDKMGAAWERVRKMKKKIQSMTHPKKVPFRRVTTYKAVARDLEMGLELAQDVRTAVQVCARRMQQVREMQKRVLELQSRAGWSASQSDSAEIRELHRDMAKILAEIRGRADEVAAHCDHLTAGSNRVRKYWYQQRQMELMYAKSELDVQRFAQTSRGTAEMQ